MFSFSPFAFAAFTSLGNVALPPPVVNWGDRGGISKKKQSKNFKNERPELENDIANAIAKVTGKVPEVEVEVEVPDYSAQIQEMVMQAQAIALQAEIDRLIQDELDDEESLMLLL